MKKLKSLTKLEEEKKKIRNVEEQLEVIEATGQENEKQAAKWVIEKENENVHEQNESRAVSEWKLHDTRKKIWTYNDNLLEEMTRMILLSDVPSGYRVAPRITTKGLALWVRDKKGNWYAKGMTISGIPKYDLNGLDRLLEKALNYIDLMDNPEKDPDGQLITTT